MDIPDLISEVIVSTADAFRTQQEYFPRVIHGLTTVMNSTLMPFPIDEWFFNIYHSVHD